MEFPKTSLIKDYHYLAYTHQQSAVCYYLSMNEYHHLQIQFEI